MLSKLINILPNEYRNRWVLDQNEKKFIRFTTARMGAHIKKNDIHVLIQMANDYYFLCLFHEAIFQLHPAKISGIWCQTIMSSPREEKFQWPRRKLRQLFKFLDKLKWSKLYTAAGVKETFSLRINSFKSLKNLLIAYRDWKRIKSKNDLLRLSLEGTPCGDLIYDTYLRYRIQPTVDINDPFLWLLITEAYNVQEAMRNILKKNNFSIYLTSYTSYIQHGIPAREALLAGVPVYSAGNLSQFFKKLSLHDNLHTSSHWMYKDTFKRLDDKEDKLKEAEKRLMMRFNGGVDQATLYMSASAFSNSNLTLPDEIEGVVFLHDFFDSPHCHRTMLFVDFIEWINHTLNIIVQHNLPFAIKPHPNQLPESRDIVEKLRLEYPQVTWLSSDISNKTIFSSGIKCGVSVYGTILHELAYHKIVAISAGDHPHTDFDIAYTPVSISEYEKMLCNYKSLSLSENIKNEVLAYYYMHNLYDKEDLAEVTISKDIRYIDAISSDGLQKYIEVSSSQSS